MKRKNINRGFKKLSVWQDADTKPVNDAQEVYDDNKG